MLYFVMGLIVIVILKFTTYKDGKTVIGDIGESKVSHILSSLGDNFEVRNNVHCLGGQIDHVVIYNGYPKQIFVIETKLWGGNISGTVNSKKWTQSKGENRNYLYNPILQNKKHCGLMQCKFNGAIIYNVVVMCGSGSFPNIDGVVHVSALRNYIIDSV